MIQVTAHRLDNKPFYFNLEEPDNCPCCHRSIHPSEVVAAYLHRRGLVQAIFRCTHNECEELFIATYLVGVDLQPTSVHTSSLLTLSPIKFQRVDFADTIKTISPNFVEIYNQALDAESHGLVEIVGIGMRKALEFLIKDFVISEHPELKDAILGNFLSNCIKNYVTDPNVKQCAERAVWLGNDEAHYRRKWENTDINDLKRLIKLSVHWIESAIVTKEYLASLPNLNSDKAS